MRGIRSRCLQYILTKSVNISERVKSQWEKVLGVEWSEDEWVNLKKSRFFCSKNVTVQENRKIQDDLQVAFSPHQN